MDRIVFEVDDDTGRAYRKLGPVRQQQLRETIAMVLKKAANDASVAGYKKLLDEFGNTAVKNGLTQEILNELLKENG